MRLKSPESIPLTTGCIENDKDTFLDLDITLEKNRFTTKIYNKVDDFDFEVVIFPFPTSNMSDHISYNSFYSQLVRFSSVCSKFNDFNIHSKNLLESLLEVFLNIYLYTLAVSPSLRGSRQHKRNNKNNRGFTPFFQQ